MKWVAINTLGAMVWLLGVFYARGPQSGIFAGGGHQFSIGLAFGVIGLAILLWTNLRSTT